MFWFLVQGDNHSWQGRHGDETSFCPRHGKLFLHGSLNQEAEKGNAGAQQCTRYFLNTIKLTITSATLINLTPTHITLHHGNSVPRENPLRLSTQMVRPHESQEESSIAQKSWFTVLVLKKDLGCKKKERFCGTEEKESLFSRHQ